MLQSETGLDWAASSTSGRLCSAAIIMLRSAALPGKRKLLFMNISRCFPPPSCSSVSASFTHTRFLRTSSAFYRAVPQIPSVCLYMYFLYSLSHKLVSKSIISLQPCRRCVLQASGRFSQPQTVGKIAASPPFSLRHESRLCSRGVRGRVGN